MNRQLFRKRQRRQRGDSRWGGGFASVDLCYSDSIITALPCAVMYCPFIPPFPLCAEQRASRSQSDSPLKCCLIAPSSCWCAPKDSSTPPRLTLHVFGCLSLLSFSPASLSPWFRTELPIHHPVHRRHFPPDHPGDSVRLLEALQVRATLSSYSSVSLSPPLLWYWTEGMCD